MSIPKNVKQIGTIDDSICIYLEDYVYTYLYQYAKKDLSGEKVAFLVGKKDKTVNEKTILISGAIEAKYTKDEEGKLVFTHQTWSYVESMLQNYFEDYEVIGWMCSQPGYGLFMTSHHVEIHNKYFSSENQLLFLMDPVEKNEQFYIWNNNRLKEMKGYFIYYDRNEDMHNYMIDDKLGRPNTKKSIHLNDDIYKMRNEDQKEKIELDTKQGKRDTRDTRSTRGTRSIRSTRDISDTGDMGKEGNKNYVSMLTSLSAVLLAVCVVMGLGLLNNSNKVSVLEKNIESLYAQINMIETRVIQEAKPVIAVQNPDQTKGQDDKNIIVEKNNNDIVTVEENNSNKIEKVDEIDTEEVTKKVSAQTTEEKEEPVVQPEEYTEYKVEAGDSLVKISWRFFNSNRMVDKIMEINNIDNVNKIYEGKVLKIPKS